MEINKLSQALNVVRYEKNSPKASKEEQEPTGKAIGQQDKIEISKEALAASEKGNAQDVEKGNNKDNPENGQNPILKMSDEARANLVARLKEDMEKEMTKLFDFVRKTLETQGKVLAELDEVWKFIASGEYEVDEQTKKKAEKAISENGEFGVKKTSERIFDFALAMSGGDPEKMKLMESAFEEGFKEATKLWGKELPEISKQTYDAVKEKFASFYGDNTGEQKPVEGE